MEPSLLINTKELILSSYYVPDSVLRDVHALASLIHNNLVK